MPSVTRKWLAVGAAIAGLGAGAAGLALASSDAAPADVSELLTDSRERLGAAVPTYRTSDGALAFAPGTSYGEALRAVYVGQHTGKLPVTAEAVAPLAHGRVALIPASATGRVVIDLAAPFGYDVDGNLALRPSLFFREWPADPRTSAIGPWLEGSEIGIPKLPDCMVISARDEVKPDCGPGDLPLYEGDGLPLP